MRIREKFILSAVVVSFLSVSLIHISDRGSERDEFQMGIPGINMLKDKNYSWPGEVLQYEKFALPVNFIVPYAFALVAYLLVPLFWVFGANIVSLRLLPVLCSSGSLILIYIICKHLFNKRVAFLTILLLAADSIFVFDSILGIFVTEPILNFLFFASVALFIMYRQKAHAPLLYLSVFVFALGFSLKLTMIWRLAGLAAASLLLFSGRIRQIYFKACPMLFKKLVLCAAFSILGAALCVIYNADNAPQTFKAIKDSFSRGSANSAAVDNSSILDNLKFRIKRLPYFIKSEIINYAGRKLGEEYAVFGDVKLGIFLVSVILNLFLVNMLNLNGRKRLMFIFAFYTIVFFCTCFTLFSLRDLHLNAVLPFVPFSVAFCVDALLKRVSQFSSQGGICFMLRGFVYALVFLPFLAANLMILSGWHYCLKQKDGMYCMSSSINGVVRHLKDHKIANIIVFDTELRDLLFVFTGGAVEARACKIAQSPTDDYEQEFIEFIQKINPEDDFKIFISHDSAQRGDKSFKPVIVSEINAIAQSYGKQLVLERVFRDKERRPSYALYRIKFIGGYRAFGHNSEELSNVI